MKDADAALVPHPQFCTLMSSFLCADGLQLRASSFPLPNGFSASVGQAEMTNSGVSSALRVALEFRATTHSRKHNMAVVSLRIGRYEWFAARASGEHGKASGTADGRGVDCWYLCGESCLCKVRFA